MSRKWTARKATSVDERAIDGAKFAPAYAVYRADPEAGVGTKQALRLVTAFTLLWLPVHAGIYWLAGFSLGVAVAAVALVAVTLLVVALAKWLALEDLLQKLPLLLVLAMVGVGFTFLSSEQPRKWGAEFFGSVFFLFVAVSILGGLYRPLAAAYQVITVKTPFRDLCVGASAMLVSLVLAGIAQALPRPLLEVLGFSVSGAFAGLVVLEYAAWARSNPDVSLERVEAFEKRTGVAEGAAVATRGPAGRTTIQGACAFGLGVGLLTTAAFYLATPSADFNRLLLWSGDKSENVRHLLACWLLAGVALTVGGFYVTSSSLNALRPTDPSAGLRLAWEAIRIFLTYPEVTHPLAHRLRLSWLRPVPVRLALTGVALVTVATVVIAPREKRKTTVPEPKPPASAAPVSRTPSVPPFVFAGDEALVGGEGRPFDAFARDPFAPRVFAPEQSMPSASAAPADSAIGAGITEFVFATVSAAVVPPLLIYVMVWLLGLTVLPTYFDYFEKPQSPG